MDRDQALAVLRVHKRPWWWWLTVAPPQCKQCQQRWPCSAVRDARIVTAVPRPPDPPEWGHDFRSRR